MAVRFHPCDLDESRSLGAYFWCFMNKVAILLDAEFLLKRLPSVCPSIDHKSARAVANAISRLVTGHLKDEDFTLGLKQKAVDMRIGLEIASIALKKNKQAP